MVGVEVGRGGGVCVEVGRWCGALSFEVSVDSTSTMCSHSQRHWARETEGLRLSFLRLARSKSYFNKDQVI